MVNTKTVTNTTIAYFWIITGAFLAAFAIEIFLVPANLIDGGVIGCAMILAYVFGNNLLAVFLPILSAPFLYLAYRHVGKVFLAHMLFAIIFFTASLWICHHIIPWQFEGESLEVVVIGGALLGIGVGLIIRYGGCLDGTEILAIMINKRTGISVGQVVLFFNIFVFGTAGIVFQDWHPAILSLITFIVATKVMDAVIVGLDETKSVLIISPKSQEIADSIIQQLGLGLTIMYGRGGYSGDDREILYVISERLQLAELKELIYSIDSHAFVAIENLHEVSNGVRTEKKVSTRQKVTNLVSMFKTK